MKVLVRASIALILLPLVTASLSFAADKISGRLQRVLDVLAPNDQAIVWVYLADKGDNEALRFSVPSTVVSERSLKRRAKVRTADALVDYSDLPVEQSYVNQIASRVIRIRQQSKWFNSISVVATKAQIAGLEALPIVKQIELLARFPRNRSESEVESAVEEPGVVPASINALNYGGSFTQVNQIGVPAVHDLGNHAEGVMVGVLDNGFRLLTHQSFDSLNIVATYDFVDHKVSVVPNNPSTSFGAHGVNTLSTIGGYRSGQLIGPAFKADYVLARTENDSSETPIEEDNWAAAIEWADSIGVDVTSTSLGYLDYDSPFTSWTWQDMNGNATVITRAADMAVGRGILVVNSAGNSGFNASHNTLGAPADGDSVFTIGAVDSFGVRSSFSSVGPTTSLPARIKPDVMAMGTAVRVASATSTTGYARSNGTSFSCPLAAGVAALMVNAWPTATPVQIMDALRSTASDASTPDNSFGWGILNAFAAMQPRVPTLASPADNATNQPLSLTLTWSAALGAETYRVQLATDSLFASLVVNDSTLTGTSKPVGPLANNTRYYWLVRSKNIAGVSAYSTRRSFTTLPLAVPPASPTLVSPANGSTNQPFTLTLQWQGSSGATNYHAQLATDSLFTLLVVNDSTLVDTSRQVNSLLPSMKYYWRVRAKNVSGSSSYTSVWSFTTLTPPPAVPTLVSPATGSTNQPLTVTLLWHPAFGAVNYHAQLATDSLFTLLVVNDSILVDTSRQVSALASTKYYWRVKAKNGGGTSSFTSFWNFRTLTPPPAAPVLVSPANGATDQATSQSFVWRASASATGYRLQLATDSLFTSLILNDSTLTDTTRIATLPGNTTIFWRTQASNTGGASPFSLVRSLTTTAQVSRHYGVAGGWNVVSVPLSVSDYRKSTLFPAAVSSAFGFAQGTGYAIKDTLANGAGYWLKFGGADSVIITGVPLATDTIAVSTGWNFIGAVSSPVPVASILQQPPGIVVSSFFGYNGGYASSDTLQPGRGYWVKTTSVGNLVLPSQLLRATSHNSPNSEKERRAISK